MQLLIPVICLISPIFGIFLSLYYYLKSKKVLFSALCIGIAYGAFCYSYVPDLGNDIYRHIQNMHGYANLNLLETFNVGFYNNLYTWDIWLWIVSKFNNDYLLQASGAFVGYTCILYMFFDYAKLIILDNKKIKNAFLITLLTISISGMAIGIRNMNAIALCTIGLYMFNIKNKKFTGLIFIILGFFLHHSIILIILVWLLFPLIKKNKYIGIIIFAILIFGFTNYEKYQLYFANSNFFLADIINDSLNTAKIYKSFEWNSFHTIISRLISFLLNGIILLRFFSSFKTQKKDERNVRILSLANFSTIIFAISIFLSFILQRTGDRYMGLCGILKGILLCYSFNIIGFLKGNEKIFDLFIIILIILSEIIKIYDLSWGTASGISIIYGYLFGIIGRLFV